MRDMMYELHHSGQFDPERVSAETKRLAQVCREALQAVQETPGISRSRLMQALGINGRNKAAYADLVTATHLLAAQGVIEQRVGPKRAVQHYPVKTELPPTSPGIGTLT